MLKRTASLKALSALAGHGDRQVLRMYLAASVMAHPRNQAPPNDLDAMVRKALEMADKIIEVVDSGG